MRFRVVFSVFGVAIVVVGVDIDVFGVVDVMVGVV